VVQAAQTPVSLVRIHIKRKGRLSSTRADNGLVDFGDLVACPDDRVASLILHVLDVLVFTLGTLPDLNLTAAANYPNPHGREEVVRAIGVHINTAIKHSGSILSESAADESLATGVLFDEISHIVNNTGHGDETSAILDLFNIVVPLDDWELIKRNTPIKFGSLLVELLLELLDTAFFDLVGTELLQVISKAKLAPKPNAPLGRVVLVPLNGVTVVRGELVVEIMVALAESDQGGNNMVSGTVAVVERLVTEPVGKRVDAEGGLLDEEDAEDTSVDISTHPIAPADASHKGWEYQTHEEHNLEIVAVLPDDDRVFIEISYISTANAFRILFHDHPA